MLVEYKANFPRFISKLDLQCPLGVELIRMFVVLVLQAHSASFWAQPAPPESSRPAVPPPGAQPAPPPRVLQVHSATFSWAPPASRVSRPLTDPGRSLGSSSHSAVAVGRGRGWPLAPPPGLGL